MAVSRLVGGHGGNLAAALMWTASFLPNFLEPSSVTVMLVKPVTRWNLLAGKYLGIVAFVGLHFVGFVVGTWLALRVVYRRLEQAAIRWLGRLS
jgi:hypothetical protein